MIDKVCVCVCICVRERLKLAEISIRNNKNGMGSHFSTGNYQIRNGRGQCGNEISFFSSFWILKIKYAFRILNSLTSSCSWNLYEHDFILISFYGSTFFFQFLCLLKKIKIRTNCRQIRKTSHTSATH